MVRIAVLVSGGGTNLQALLDAQAGGEIPAGEIVLVISSRQEAKALERAQKAGVKARILEKKSFESNTAYDEAMAAALAEEKIDLVVLAGFMTIVGPKTLEAYPGRIVNIHPSLLPAFAGEYGLRVHQAALARGVKLTGATVHLVNDVVDGGEILLQKAVEVREGDTPEALQQRVMEEAEWRLLPRAVNTLCAQIDAAGTT